jgi:hypothetical protein
VVKVHISPLCFLLTQAVESVLAECGQDIDAAIRRLTELKLSTVDQQQQQAHAHAAMAAASQQHDTAGVADGGQQQQVPAGPQTADQWVDALVQEMAAAKDFTDARGRATKMLQAFEQFVSARSKEVSTVALHVHVLVCLSRCRPIICMALQLALTAMRYMPSLCWLLSCKRAATSALVHVGKRHAIVRQGTFCASVVAM